MQDNIKSEICIIGGGITGLSTAYYLSKNGKEVAKKYYEANEKALKNIKQIIEDEKIECDFENRNAYNGKIFENSSVIDVTWTAEDCISLDKIPYIGEFSNVMDNVYVATGFNKWGMTSANISANIIKNEILNMMKDSSEGIIAKRLKTKKTPTCTHLGCKLSFNPIEETWDCMCHGSRFLKNGEVLESPANKNIEVD